MSHYAHVVNGIVDAVLVVEQDVIDSGVLGYPSEWIQTSFNTKKGVHSQGGTPLRANYAGIGFIYDAVNDVFYPPSPFPSWQLDTTTWSWYAPTPQPVDTPTVWDEEQIAWVPVPIG